MKMNAIGPVAGDRAGDTNRSVFGEWGLDKTREESKGDLPKTEKRRKGS